MNRYLFRHDTEDSGMITAGRALGGVVVLAITTVTCMGRVEESLRDKLKFDRPIVAVDGDTPIDMAQEHCKDPNKVAAAVIWIENNNVLPIQPKQAVSFPDC